MNQLEVIKLTRYRKYEGTLSIQECLQLAIEAEQLKKDCSPYDIAYSFFAKQERVMLDYAELLEKEANDANAE